MMKNLSDLNARLARHVTADTLIACQQSTNPKFKTAADFRQKTMVKHPFLSDFHSEAEYLHAGLLEGNNQVFSYVPQPYRLRLFGKYYPPDCYVAFTDGPRKVLELKPEGKFPEQKRIALEQFFAQHQMIFEVVSNESVFERRIEAENWLEIVENLQIAKEMETQTAEEDLLDKLYKLDSCNLGDIVDAGDRERTYLSEIALFRLLHRGHLKAELTERLLDYDTEISLCR